MEMQAYRELHCYQYIMKPFHRKQVEEVVQKVLEKENREKTTGDRCEKDGINYQLKCEDIRYLEAIPRGTRLHLVTENWDVPYVTLRQMLLKMPKGMFAQCHRMYAVNKNEVEYYDTVNRIIRIKNCPDTVEIGVTYKSVIGGLLNG
ncbi:MAG: LytR/AlgR family response regulator transcription factor [Coprococcus sp.]